jgi:uncharacterized protein
MTNEIPQYPERKEGELASRVEVFFEEMIKNPYVLEALGLLNELPEYLTYHNKEHTLDVIHETILFGLTDNLSLEDLELECVSAAWHDVGYLERYEENEPIAVEMFQNSKAYGAFSEEQRGEIVANILDTQIIMQKGAPSLLMRRSRLGYVLDADVSNFGRKDYFKKRLLVAEELGLDLLDIEVKKKFYAFAIELLKKQEWRTAAAQSLRQGQKELNLRLMEQEYSQL